MTSHIEATESGGYLTEQANENKYAASRDLGL